MADAVQIFRALADETRLRILNLLSRGELCVCDIMKVLDVPQSKASRHLAHLRASGLVTVRREGVWMHYSLAAPSGTLHQRLPDWLAEEGNGIPHGATDVGFLDRLRRSGELCSQLPLCERNGAGRAAATAKPRRPARGTER
jgi:ArsR family transcriptional regulator